MNEQINDDWQFNLEDFALVEPSVNIDQLKLIHHYYLDNDIESGTLIETSAEFIKKLNLKTNNYEWKKIITHVFKDTNNKIKTAKTEEIINNPEDIVNKMNNLKLESLKNNYYCNEESREEYWEIIYNNMFKIVGSYRVELEQLKIINELFDFQNIKKDKYISLNDSNKEEGDYNS